MAVTASHYDTTSRDFHVVNIGDASSTAPRRRSASAGRSESWMAKVTTAMSHRLFSGRRLSTSRSTQVMPMLQGKEQGSHGSSRGDETSDEGSANFDRPPRDRAHSLRHALSEAALPRGTAASFDPDSAKASPAAYPTVVCDIEPNEGSDDETRGAAIAPSKCSVNTIHVRTPRKTPPQTRPGHDKVRPNDRSSEWAEDDIAQATSAGEQYASIRFCGGRDEDPATVQTATPILKDFFTRNATTTHRERAQQRESRRGQHYRSSKERHERLREKCRQEDQNQADRIQREKIDRLRKLNQQRRIQMRQEAATLKKRGAASSATMRSQFEIERERWEQAFETEIDTLGKAYRRAYAQEGDSMRPMTVAGMAVPEAISQIQRDNVIHKRRVQTATPAGWSSLPDSLMMTEWKELSTLHIEDSKEIHDIFRDDIGVQFSTPHDMLDATCTIKALLTEKEEMARRIAHLEQELEKANLCVVVEAANTVGLEDGFFI